MGEWEFCVKVNAATGNPGDGMPAPKKPEVKPEVLCGILFLSEGLAPNTWKGTEEEWQ